MRIKLQTTMCKVLKSFTPARFISTIVCSDGGDDGHNATEPWPYLWWVENIELWGEVGTDFYKNLWPIVTNTLNVPMVRDSMVIRST
jgi:hypothetical protein